MGFSRDSPGRNEDFESFRSGPLNEENPVRKISSLCREGKLAAKPEKKKER